MELMIKVLSIIFSLIFQSEDLFMIGTVMYYQKVIIGNRILVLQLNVKFHIGMVLNLVGQSQPLPVYGKLMRE